MRRASCWALVGVTAAGACGPSAEAPSNDLASTEIPEALALALITNTAEESRIFVGSPPDEVEAVAPLATDVAVLGGLTWDDGGIIVLRVDSSPESALAQYAAEIERQGWERAPDDQGLRGGFEPSPRSAAATWCNESHWIRASAGDKHLRVRYRELELGPTPCDNARMRSGRAMAPYELRLPRLTPPPGAEVRMSGGGGSTSDVNMDALIVTGLGAGELFEHYARQLAEAGWKARTDASSNGMAIGRWSAEDDRGEPALGLFAVWPLPEEGSFRAWVRLERVSGER